MYILASGQDFFRWNNYYQNAIWISFVSGAIGFGILLAGLRDRLRKRSTDTLGIETLVGVPNRPVVIKPVQWPRILSQIGLLYAQFFLLLAICVIIAVLGYRNFPPQGFLLSWKNPAVVWEKSPWPETLGVYVHAPARFFINSEEIKRNDLRTRLLEQLRRRAEWTVYFEADNDTLFSDDAYAIDTIQACGARVVWVTPKMRRELQHNPQK